MSNKKTIFMPVYNEMDFDGRVQRCAETLSEKYHVTTFSVDSLKGYSHSQFDVRKINLSLFGSSGGFRYVYFCIILIFTSLYLRPRMIYAHDYFTAFPSRISAFLTGALLVYDAHELIIPEKEFKLGLRSKIFYWLEKLSLGRASLVIAANPERAELMKNHYGLRIAPTTIRNIAIVPETFSNEKAVNSNYPELKRHRGGLIRLVFQGYLSADRGVIGTVKALVQLPSNFELVLVGTGPDRDLDAIKRSVKKLNLEKRVIFLGRVPQKDLHAILRTCDIGVVYYFTRTLNHLYCASNKIYEYTQAGLPVVSTSQPPLLHICETYQIGEIIGSGRGDQASEISGIVEASKLIASNMETYVDRIPSFLEENNWKEESKKLKAAVNELL